jgi:hypothetical protein
MGNPDAYADALDEIEQLESQLAAIKAEAIAVCEEVHAEHEVIDDEYYNADQYFYGQLMKWRLK